MWLSEKLFIARGWVCTWKAGVLQQNEMAGDPASTHDRKSKNTEAQMDLFRVLENLKP